MKPEEILEIHEYIREKPRLKSHIHERFDAPDYQLNETLEVLEELGKIQITEEDSREPIIHQEWNEPYKVLEDMIGDR